MKRIFASFVVSLFVLTFVPGESEATIPSCLKISGTILTAGESSESGDVFKQKMLKVRFSQKDILDALNQLFGPLPKGTCIQVTPEDAPTPDSVALVDGEGNVLPINISAFLSVDLATENNLFTGSFNNETSAESSLILFLIEIELNIPAEGIELELGGVAFERFKAGPEQAGIQKVKATIKGKVAGDGTFEGQLAFVEAKAVLAGKGDFD